jgi:hypothetical protein
MLAAGKSIPAEQNVFSANRLSNGNMFFPKTNVFQLKKSRFFQIYPVFPVLKNAEPYFYHCQPNT